MIQKLGIIEQGTLSRKIPLRQKLLMKSGRLFQSAVRREKNLFTFFRNNGASTLDLRGLSSFVLRVPAPVAGLVKIQGDYEMSIYFYKKYYF
jgi:hypothetical protein